MSLSNRQQHQLLSIETRLFRSDPQLAARLAVFARLAADQGLPAWEQVAGRPDRIRQAAAMIAKAIAGLAASIALLGSALLALFAAIAVGGRARPAPADREERPTGPGADGRPGLPPAALGG